MRRIVVCVALVSGVHLSVLGGIWFANAQSAKVVVPRPSPMRAVLVPEIQQPVALPVEEAHSVDLTPVAPVQSKSLPVQPRTSAAKHQSASVDAVKKTIVRQKPFAERASDNVPPVTSEASTQRVTPLPVKPLATTDSAPNVERVTPSSVQTSEHRADEVVKEKATVATTAAAVDKPVSSVPKTTQPQHRAGYLKNPKPHYPEISRDEGEEGRVVVKVFVRADGSAGEVVLQKSSGFARLDRAAVEAVKQWRFVPAKRGDEPIDMWYSVPIPFELN